MSRRIIIHSLQHARAAIAAAHELRIPVTLASATGAGAYAGPLWFKALIDAAAASHPDASVEAVLDCADEAGTVLAALRTGFRRIVFTGAPAARERLAAIAAEYGAVIESGEAAEAALDLLGRRDPAALCRAYLTQAGLTQAGTPS